MTADSTPNTTIDLTAIEARLAKRTPGEWVVGRSDWDDSMCEVVTLGERIAVCDEGQDAPFIAHAPTDIAALLARVRALEAALTARVIAHGCHGDFVCFACGDLNRVLNN